MTPYQKFSHEAMTILAIAIIVLAIAYIGGWHP